MAADSYDCLWDGFEPVAVRIGKQNRTIKEFSSYMQKRAEIEESYAKSLLRLSQSTFGKSEKGSVVVCIQALKQEAEAIGKAHQTFAQKLNQDTHVAIDAFLKSTSKSRDKAVQRGAQLTKDLGNCKIAESRFKDKYYKMAEKGKNDPKQAKKIEEANKDYEKKVSVLKQAQTAYYNDMPGILRELQSFDEQCLEKYKASVDALATHSKALPTAINDTIKSFESLVSVFDSSQEVKDFINQHYTGEDRPPFAVYVPYGTDPSTVKAERPPSVIIPPSSPKPVPPPKANSESDKPPRPAEKPTSDKPAEKAPENKPKPPEKALSPKPPEKKADDSKKDEKSQAEEPKPKRKQTATRISTLFKNPPKFDDDAKHVEYKYSYYEYNAEGDNQSWKVQALYDWKADDPDEISLKAGDVLTVQYEDEGGWYTGTNKEGKQGRFPSNYVVFI